MHIQVIKISAIIFHLWNVLLCLSALELISQGADTVGGNFLLLKYAHFPEKYTNYCSKTKSTTSKEHTDKPIKPSQNHLWGLFGLMFT
jgi:hypothetical protein